MTRLIPACLLIAGFWLSMMASGSAQQAPGKSDPVKPLHTHTHRHYPAKSHGRHHAHTVRRNEGTKGAPIEAPNAQASHGYDPAPEFTVTPHMMLNFGVGGRL